MSGSTSTRGGCGDISREVDPEIFMQILTTIAQNMVNPTYLTEHDLTMGQMIGQVRVILLYGLASRDGAAEPQEVS
jgi:hypothetical protein